MIEYNKQLLLKDLYARLGYNVRVRYIYQTGGTAAIHGYSDEGVLNAVLLTNFSEEKFDYHTKKVCNIVPYLRSMSSMTEDEKKIYKNLELSVKTSVGLGKYSIWRYDDLFDWLNAHHFDYRGLIEKGLALEAPENMYKID